jgi:hypothetical protein
LSVIGYLLAESSKLKECVCPEKVFRKVRKLKVQNRMKIGFVLLDLDKEKVTGSESDLITDTDNW